MTSEVELLVGRRGAFCWDGTLFCDSDHHDGVLVTRVAQSYLCARVRPTHVHKRFSQCRLLGFIIAE